MSVGLRGQVKSAVVSFATIGDQTVVPAVAGKVIVVVALLLVSAGTTTVIVRDGATSLSGAMSLVVGVPLFLDEKTDFDYYPTSSGANNLVINNSAGTQVSGTIWYVQE